jgi:hypothetical protein
VLANTNVSDAWNNKFLTFLFELYRLPIMILSRAENCSVISLISKGTTLKNAETVQI